MNQSSQTSSSVFESFNARNLSPRQVAETFIPPEQIFRDLSLRSHSLIIGPRGSGKTTLLKMLQVPALVAWNHPNADEYKKIIDFTGVFIPTDVSWGAQLDAIGTTLLSPEVKQTLGLAAFTTHILISFVEALRECTKANLESHPILQKHSASLDRSMESVLVKQICSNWKLNIEIPSLDSLKLGLRNRLSAIAEFANKVSYSDEPNVIPQLQKIPEFHLDFIDALVFGIEAFGIATRNEERKWALLFDELEIAPEFIRKRLFQSLRSTDQRLLFKLSISPYSQDLEALDSSNSAMPMQDYKTIELWYPRKEGAYKFCESLLSSMLNDTGCSLATPIEIFGTSAFDQDDTEGVVKGYLPGSKVQNKFKALAKIDISFANYLKKHSIDLNNIHNMSDNLRASLIRKITSIVTVRETFKSSDDAIRSRKNPDLYTGAKSLFAIVEGNPRWFIGLIGPLLREFNQSNEMVNRANQAKAITAATNKFRSLLKTIPFSPKRGRTGSRGLLSLLDDIGFAFNSKVVKDAFNPEPPLSFTVDALADAELLAALGRALNAGAIIYVPDEGSDLVLNSLKGKRFRLSYMLAPYYKLPLLLGSARSLNSLIQNDKHSDLFPD